MYAARVPALQLDMAFVTKRGSPLRHGNILVRPKKNGMGYHYARLVNLDNITPQSQIPGGIRFTLGTVEGTPEAGQRIGTIPEFTAEMPWGVIETRHTEAERWILDQSALVGLGSSYGPFHNCEDVALGFSPTRDKIIGGAAVAGLLYLLLRELFGNN